MYRDTCKLSAHVIHLNGSMEKQHQGLFFSVSEIQVDDLSHREL